MAIINLTIETLTENARLIERMVYRHLDYKDFSADPECYTTMEYDVGGTGVGGTHVTTMHLQGTPLNNRRFLIGHGWGLPEILNLEAEPGTHYISQRGYELYLTSGFLLDTETNTPLRYRANPSQREQLIWSPARDRFTPLVAHTTSRSLKAISWGDLSPGHRASYMTALADRLEGETRRHHTRLVAEITRPATHSGFVHARGRVFAPRAWHTDREIFGQFGKMVADPENFTPDEVVNLLNDLSGPAQGLDIHEHWNRRCGYGDEIYLAGCDHYYVDEPRYVYNGDTVCSDCLDDHYVYAVDVDDYILAEYAYCSGGDYYYEDPDDDDGDDEYPASYRVRGYNANVLEHCGPDRSIRPTPYGEFLMGVELEVVPSPSSAARAADDTAEDFEDYAILKHDGSLPDRGFEIVTAPRGLKEHIKRFKDWEPHRSLRAWDSGVCGMHVHISSQAFTQATLGKFIEFINSRENDKFITAIAGRHPETDRQSREYCRREGTLAEGNPKKTLTGKSPNRYHMVNTQNLTFDEADRLGLSSDHTSGHGINTVELRIFKATLKKERLLAQLEFAHAAVMFCRWASFRALTGREFLEWLQGMAGQYPHLARWYGVRANTKARETADV